MASVSTSNQSWVTNALQSSRNQSLRSLEEVSMHVAKDLEWLQDYRSEALVSLVVSRDTAGPQTSIISGHEDHEGAVSRDHHVHHEDVPVAIMSVEHSMEHVKNNATEKTTDVHAGQTTFASQLIERKGDCSIIRPASSVSESSSGQEAAVGALQEHANVSAEDVVPKTSSEFSNSMQSPVATGREAATETNKIPLKIIGKETSTGCKQVKPVSAFLPEDETVIVPALQNDTRPITNNQEVDTDYLQPINLNSPEKTSHRNDSAYYSAAESPSTTSVTQSSPRKSIAFASLPPRQPFAKKSLGPRSSQSRTSVFDGPRSSQKLTAREPSEQTVIKVEALSTPQITNRTKSVPSGQAAEIEAGERTIDTHQTDHIGITGKDSLKTETQNPYQADLTGQTKQPRVVAGTSTEDDDWLPRFETSLPSPRKPREVSHTAEPSTMQHAAQPVQTNTSTRPDQDMALVGETERFTPGPIKAAMQAASAKATSYLRQARTAFGSPSINHTKVFRSTTPMQSPPKPRLKMEPQTPKLYPNLDASMQPGSKPSMIPSKTPIKHQGVNKIASDPPRRSPRRSPKKGSEATQSMAVIAARNASVKATTEAHAGSLAAKHDIEHSRNDSPPKPARLVNKPLTHAKTKPLSIRVATASQREIDNTKDRKVPSSLVRMHENGSTAVLSRSTMENGQLEYLSKSQQGNVKRPAPNRQIKALAAATQAKEKAEKEQERREQQKRDLEKKRHENAKRQVHEEEKRKNEVMEELNKKRKAAEARLLSAKKMGARPASTNASSRAETQLKDHDSMYTKDNRQSVKRALTETDENAMNTVPQDVKRQRISEQADTVNSVSHTGSTVISKPIRVSLQKKSLFGHPGEPGYKKPGTTTLTKPGPVVDSVKFSNEPIRFAATSTTSTTIVTAQEQIKVHNLPPSELIELPEINSDYSDSDDDEPAQKDAFERPNWAETPELRKLLRKQQRIDPDDVFGPIPPLQMEEIFKGKERALARFRPRSSSANWSGNDKLSAEEVTDYARAMGYKN